MSDCGDVKKVFVPTQPSKEEVTETIRGIKITDVAAEKIRLFLENDGKDVSEYCLWISVKKDGCSGHSYDMDLKTLSPLLENNEKHFELNGSHVVVDKKSYLFVLGSILDYTEALTGSGFTLTNPNIKKSCSCGSSFAV